MNTKSIKLSLAIISLSISLSQTLKAQSESAEERMNRIFSPTVTAKASNNVPAKSTAPKNAPGNMISEKQIYWYYFKNQHKNINTNKEVVFNIDNANEDVINYLKSIYNIDINYYDEFERRRVLAKTKDEIKAGIATIDYTTEYTKSVPVESMGEYSFSNNSLRFDLRNNRSFLHKFTHLDFLAINIPAVVSHMYVHLNEADAEKVVKHLKGSDIGRNVIAVQYIKMTPIVIEGKNGHKYVLATESKTEFYYMEWEDGNWNYGDKIGESEWLSSDPFPHPEIY